MKKIIFSVASVFYSMCYKDGMHFRGLTLHLSHFIAKQLAIPDLHFRTLTFKIFCQI